MSYIPNCRTNEYYNQNQLQGADKDFLQGYDWAVEQALDNFFDNIETMEDDYILRFLNEKVPEYRQELYNMDYTFPKKHNEYREVKTYADFLRMNLLHWAEIQRNELITSMIDAKEE